MNFLKRILLCLIFLAAVFPACPAEWQWSLAVTNCPENSGAARAWLWIPPNCERVRGVVVVAQHNLEEISILENPKFRAALADL
jgi:hypothetical protein